MSHKSTEIDKDLVDRILCGVYIYSLYILEVPSTKPWGICVSREPNKVFCCTRIF